MWKDKVKEIGNVYAEHKKRLNKGCSGTIIEEFKSEVSDDFGYDLPDEYLLFLRHVNGIDFNGFIIYGVDDFITDRDDNDEAGFIESNEEWYENEWQKNYIFFGESDTSWYCFDMTKEEYVEIDNPSGEFLNAYTDFNSMLEKVLGESLL